MPGLRSPDALLRRARRWYSAVHRKNVRTTVGVSAPPSSGTSLYDAVLNTDIAHLKWSVAEVTRELAVTRLQLFGSSGTFPAPGTWSSAGGAEQSEHAVNAEYGNKLTGAFGGPCLKLAVHEDSTVCAKYTDSMRHPSSMSGDEQIISKEHMTRMKEGQNDIYYEGASFTAVSSTTKSGIEKMVAVKSTTSPSSLLPCRPSLSVRRMRRMRRS